MKEKTNKRNVVIGIVCIAIIIFVIFAGIYGNDFYQRIVLYSEVSRLSQLDITEDQFMSEIKTTGEYSKVEEAIKEYFSEYSKSLQASLEAISEENLNAIMSDENLTQDAPDFENTLANIQKTKEEFNTNLDNVLELMDETYIMKKIQEKGVSKEIEELYQELMYDEEIMIQLEEQKIELEASRTLLNELLDLNGQLYRLLAENPGKWKYEDGIMQIDDEELLNRYNEIIEKMQEE